MSQTFQVIRLEPNGPTGIGLEPMDLDPADFHSPLPQQHIHVYFEDEDLGLSVGVWSTTSMQEAFGPYPGDEFMWVLEGEVRMVDASEVFTLIESRETFCIRNAIPISWKQEGFLRKFYMTYADPSASTPKIASAFGGVRILDHIAQDSEMMPLETTDPFVISGEPPVQRDQNIFANDAGNMFVGVWDSTPFESDMLPFPCHEMVRLLQGEVTITEENGSNQTFVAGDVFFIPAGTVCSWRAEHTIKKYYSMLTVAN
ncbi:MAG: cupin domain-containing protein [Pseudomonadota bacterium]